MNLQEHRQAVAVRRNAAVILEHAVARLGYWADSPDCDHDAVWIIHNAQWGIEAMDSPASNRFWDEERRKYNEMLAEIGGDL